MDGKAFMAFLADLEEHHGRRFNEKSIQLLAPRFMKLPTEAITEEARLTLKAGFNTIPAPMHVATILEAEAAKVRTKKAVESENEWNREKTEERKALARLSDPELDDFNAKAFRLMLLMSSQASRAKKFWGQLEMCEAYPEVYPITDYWAEVAQAEAAGLVATCGISGELVGPDECPLYLAALTV